MNFITIDFETANYERDSAISIGLVKFENGQKKSFFTSFIKPCENVSPDYILEDFIDIHGITFYDIKDAPTFDVLWESDLKKWLDGSLPLVAHNAGFDMGVLGALFEKYSIKHNSLSYFDSLCVAKNVWPEFENHRLTTLGEKFGIVYDAHDALADSETCGKVILLAAKKLNSKTVEELLDASGKELKYL